MGPGAANEGTGEVGAGPVLALAVQVTLLLTRASAQDIFRIGQEWHSWQGGGGWGRRRAPVCCVSDSLPLPPTVC